MENRENASETTEDVKKFIEAPLSFKNPSAIRHDEFDEPFLKHKLKKPQNEGL